MLEGDFPHARMMNFEICAPWQDYLPYRGDGTGIPEISFLDEDIVPDPGHANPFRDNADRTVPKRHFHVTFELKDGNPYALNGAAVSSPRKPSLRLHSKRKGWRAWTGPVGTDLSPGSLSTLRGSGPPDHTHTISRKGARSCSNHSRI